ncbi:hypothetical protein RchiOBHm_Chr1g0356531 [Rosa chinensis]|uniref:Uncharacterized protein n=1 Tax=Rosa chinensis TaxID=74649 RepID=A0A2P6SHN2_ROSCH|nr:hypothetical protein RchiOBHm_Chr1g0356531 [Rosa chinensis]
MAYFIWIESSLSLLSIPSGLASLYLSEYEIWACEDRKVIAGSSLHSLVLFTRVGWTSSHFISSLEDNLWQL